MLKSHSFPECSMKRYSIRIACIVGSLLLVSTLSACTKGLNTSKTTTETTGAGTTATAIQTQASATTTSQISVPAGDITVGWSIDSVNIRSGPGTDYSGIGGLLSGEKVNILGKEGDWYKIQFKDGVGYVSAQFISATEIITTAANGTATTAATTVPQQ